MIPYKLKVKLIFFLILVLSFLSCVKKSDRIKNIIGIAENYVTGQMKSPDREISENGVVIIGEGTRKVFIDPSSIFTGPIDNDEMDDALITIVSYDDGYLGMIEHLILINTNGRLSMQRSVESDMKILELKDGIITAELPTHPRSSPLYNCSECREVVRFRYRDGELVKAE